MAKTMAKTLQAALQTSFSLAALFCVGLFARPVAAELVNENLLAGLPPGYKVGFHDKQGNLEMTEWVPAKETVDNWTEMVTVQIFFGLKISPEQFMQSLESRWRGACPGAGDAQPIVGSVENGYQSLLWILECPKNPATGKPELTWIKGVQGNDSFYVVQKAFKFNPNKEQIVRWVEYLRAVRVCDSRIAERACPQSRN
jgi:hypothetical protein